MEIGSKIKQLRYKAGLTQEQLASSLGISAQSVSKWKNGITMPDITLLPALAEGYTVKNSDFFKIGIPFTLAAIIPAYIYLWLMYGV